MMMMIIVTFSSCLDSKVQCLKEFQVPMLNMVFACEIKRNTIDYYQPYLSSLISSGRPVGFLLWHTLFHYLYCLC